MKTSTLMTTVLLSASCFAAPVRTAQEAVAEGGATAPAAAVPYPIDRDVPVAPPAPNVPAATGSDPEHWQYLALPKSRRLDQSIGPELHLQT